LATHRTSHQPYRSDGHLVEHGREVVEVREAVRDPRRVPIAAHVVRDDIALALERLGDRVPGSAIGHTRVEQDHALSVARPALTRKGGGAALHGELLRCHRPILTGGGGRRGRGYSSAGAEH